MSDGAWFAVLGPLWLTDRAGMLMAVPGARQRVLLAALLLSANVPVSCDALAEAVWDGSPPAGAAATLRSHIRRLRRALGPGNGLRITARDPGYLICVHEAELDVLRFEASCQAAGAARQAGRWAEVSAAAAAALELWRGTPLLDVPSQVLRDQFVPWFEQMRLQVLEDRIEADLRLGQHNQLVPELKALATQHPLRERFCAQLMLALARAGRRAEALKAYRQTWRALADDLAVEPGPELQLLHQRILAGDSTLSAPQAELDGTPGATACRTPAPAVVPRQLPATVQNFIGREAVLAELTALLDAAQAGGSPMAITAINGGPGVGKTALAVHWAHHVAARFPDGQLYVDLDGYAAGDPLPAADALAGLLRALGMSGNDVPPGVAERAALYRSILAGRQMLVVLDNARETDQVRPLLPGTGRSVALVTSRDSLAGLVARHGAVRVELDMLPQADALALLRALLGARVDAEPEAAAALAAHCCRLPLALRVAAESALTRREAPLAVLAGELISEQRRLDLLEADGDASTGVRAVFSWSYRDLDPDAARAFRLIALHPGRDLEPHAAAALVGTTCEQACLILYRLARAHLIQPTGPGRYGMHDLLRAYARELAGASSKEACRASLGSLLDHYLNTAAAAMDALFPTSHRPPLGIPPWPTVPMASPKAAQAWLDAERANLIAAAAEAADRGWPGHATALSDTLERYLSWDTGRPLARCLPCAGPFPATAGPNHAGQFRGT